jgi:chromosomal replication initiator protein
MSVKLITLEHPNSRRAAPPTGEGAFLPVFVAGPENSELVQLMTIDDREELVRQSPVVLYGASGVGKSSVAQTIAARWIRQFSLKSFAITSGIDFVRQYALAIDSDDMEHFRLKHRQCELLLIDGIHELGDRELAQDELVHSLDALRQASSIVLVTSPKIPGVIRDLKPALISRLMGGLCLEVAFPGQDARVELIRQFAEQLSIDLDPDEQMRLAKELPKLTSAHHFRGLLLQWIHQQRVDPERQRESTLDRLIEHQQLSVVPGLNQIGKAVAKLMSVRLSDLRGQTRKANVVRARGLGILLARQLTSHSLQQIGEYFGGRDHTTVMHALRKTQSDVTTDTELNRAYDEIRQSLTRVK